MTGERSLIFQKLLQCLNQFIGWLLNAGILGGSPNSDVLTQIVKRTKLLKLLGRLNASLKRIDAGLVLQMEEAVEEESEAVGDVPVEVEALVDDGVEGIEDQAVGFGGSGGPGCNGPVEQFLPVGDPIDQHGGLHIANGLVDAAIGRWSMVAVGLAVGEALLELAGEEAVEALVEIESEGADEGGVVPGAGIGVVAEVGEVEDLGAALHGVEDLAGEIGVAVLEDSEDEVEGFEGDDPVAGLGDAFGDGGGAGRGVRFAGGDQAQDFGDVAVVERDVVVGGGFQDGHFEGGGGRVGSGGHFREADAGLVFHGVDGLAELAGHRGIWNLEMVNLFGLFWIKD